ncbi:CidA/LrgA family protein [Elizabethkingia sp. JS20170427COW]|uniref:CidA/LrgA family protein n=1 Tax=Elizabethkingia sp. JS20170427COW TaxID=2583851 RepID=UPI0011106E68|nr:CidA/LrgA family protein [Elizabethkingia sp. JS20170427COW]QCX54077.1 CidA/LrgA family protein [Elizabethkingia sp. JS20170427COW]
MIKPVLIVFGCLALGNILVSLTGIPLPASIVGMLLLTLLLMTKIVKVEELKTLSDFFNSHMAFFFVPAGVSVMLYMDIIKGQFLPIVVSSFVSTILVIIATGWTHQFMRSKNKKK